MNGPPYDRIHAVLGPIHECQPTHLIGVAFVVSNRLFDEGVLQLPVVAVGEHRTVVGDDGLRELWPPLLAGGLADGSS